MGRYWDKRSVELENLEQEKTDTDIMKVNKLFDGAIVYLQKEIGEIFDKYSKDSGLPGTAAQEMLNVKQTEEVRQALMNALAQCEDEVAKGVILGRLNAPAYAARIARLEALRDLVYAQAYKVGSAVSVTLKDRLIDTVEDSYYRTIYDMQKNTTYAYDFNKLADNDVKAAIAQNWAGGNYSSRIWKNTEKLAKNLENVIVQGLMTGQSIRTMSKRLEEAAEGDRYSINRLVRTEVNYCCNQGALMSFKDAGIEKYVFLATLDLRTSKICQSLDKKIFYVKDAKAGENYPPMHPHCRSTAAAYIEGKDTSRLKRRARDPETGKTVLVPYDMNYAEWYEKYVLGNKIDISAHGAARTLENTEKNDKIKLSNADVRKKYIDSVSKIKDSIDTSLPIEEQAQKAFEKRNSIRTEARSIMADEEMRKKLETERPNKTFEELVTSKMERKGMTREEAIQDVYDTATKTNSSVNKELGIGGE